jgi:hypothetical protein
LSIGNFSNESYFLAFKKKKLLDCIFKNSKEDGGHCNFGEKGVVFTI